MHRRIIALFLLALALAIAPLAVNAQSAEFRERVVQLALIYGESSGIDLEGFMVRAREVRKLDAECSDVEVVTWKDGRAVQSETLRACRHP